MTNSLTTNRYFWMLLLARKPSFLHSSIQSLFNTDGGNVEDAILETQYWIVFHIRASFVSAFTRVDLLGIVPKNAKSPVTKLGGCSVLFHLPGARGWYQSASILEVYTTLQFHWQNEDNWESCEFRAWDSSYWLHIICIVHLERNI